MPESKTKRILRNGTLLALSAVLMRSVSVAFNAGIARRLGEGGMGLLSLTMSVYGFAVTFATSGVALSVTRLAAEAIGRKAGGAVGRTVRAGLCYALLFGCFAGAVLYAGAEFAAVRLLGDARVAPSLRLLAFSLPPIAVSAVISGYFVAMRRPWHNAATQLLEQGTRILVTMGTLTAFAERGLEYACLAVVGGSALSEAASCLLLAVQYFADRRRHPTPGAAPEESCMRRLFGVALPTAVAAWCRSGLVTVEHLLIPVCLAMGGGDRDGALAAYAVVHGMALPVVLWPTAILGAFAGLLVPEVAESRAAERYDEIRRAGKKALLGTLALSLLSSAVMTAGADALGGRIYGSAEVGGFIRRLAPLVPVMYMDSAVDAMLKGLGHQVWCMGVNIGDAALSVLLVRLLLPAFGADGYVAMIAATEIYNFVFSAGKLWFVLRGFPAGEKRETGARAAAAEAGPRKAGG